MLIKNPVQDVVAQQLKGIPYLNDLIKSEPDDGVYRIDQAMDLGILEATVTNARMEAADLPISEKAVTEQGPVDVQQDCSAKSTAEYPDPYYADEYKFYVDLYGELKERPVTMTTEKDQCEYLNPRRQNITNYQKNNRRVVIDYHIVAKSNLNMKNIKIELTPNSGRDIYNFNLDAYPYFVSYKGWWGSKMEGKLNSGLTKKGFVWADVRNEEEPIDFMIKYQIDDQQVSGLTRIPLK